MSVSCLRRELATIVKVNTCTRNTHAPSPVSGCTRVSATICMEKISIYTDGKIKLQPHHLSSTECRCWFRPKILCVLVVDEFSKKIIKLFRHLVMLLHSFECIVCIWVLYNDIFCNNIQYRERVSCKIMTYHGYAYLNVSLVIRFQEYAETFWRTAMDAMTPRLGFIVASSCPILKPTSLGSGRA